MRWDKKKLLEPNLHVYGKNDIKIMVYSIRRWPRKRIGKTLDKKTKELVTEKRTLYWWLNYYDRVIQAMPRTIFVSYIFNTSYMQ